MSGIEDPNAPKNKIIESFYVTSAENDDEIYTHAPEIAKAAELQSVAVRYGNAEDSEEAFTVPQGTPEAGIIELYKDWLAKTFDVDE